jgi:hypothetical protein
VRVGPAGLLALALAGCTAAGRPPVQLVTVAAVEPRVEHVLDHVMLPAVPPPDPSRSSGEDALVGYLAQGDTRPFAAARTIHFDVDTLPVGKWADPSRPHGFRISPLGNDAFRLWIDSTLYAEIVVSSTRRSLEFAAFTGGMFSQGVPPECGKGHIGRFPTRWAGIDPRSWKDADVGVEMGIGDFDVATCSASARLTIETRARAILPGFLYALRVRQEDSEALVVFLPRAAWVSASGDPNFPLEQSNSGPFTRLTLPIVVGEGQTAAARVSAASLRLWSRLRQTIAPVWSFEDPAAPREDLLVGLDVISQAGSAMGTLTLSLPAKKDARPYAKVLSAARAM